jgi:hypothetical protein
VLELKHASLILSFSYGPAACRDDNKKPNFGKREMAPAGLSILSQLWVSSRGSQGAMLTVFLSLTQQPSLTHNVRARQQRIRGQLELGLKSSKGPSNHLNQQISMLIIGWRRTCIASPVRHKLIGQLAKMPDVLLCGKCCTAGTCIWRYMIMACIPSFYETSRTIPHAPTT